MVLDPLVSGPSFLPWNSSDTRKEIDPVGGDAQLDHTIRHQKVGGGEPRAGESKIAHDLH